MRTIGLWAAAALVATSGCVYGGAGPALAVASRPGGATAKFETSSGRSSGELIAVSDDGVIVASNSIMFAPFVAIKKLSIDDMSGDYGLDLGESPSAEKLARLRSVSRFPQGLTPAIRLLLLAQKGQPDIVVMK
jgi:hypothetical protein